MALLKQMKTFTILTLMGVFLYILIFGLSSNLSIFSLNYQNFITNNDEVFCKGIENWDEIVDFEWLMYENHDKFYEESSRDLDEISKKCKKYIKSANLTPKEFKFHQQQTLDIIKGRYLNFAIPNQNFKPKFSSNQNCGRFPLESDLNITDIYWQVTNTTNGTFYLYNAYYDDRKEINGLPVVRILGMINVIDPVVKTFCQFWYENVSQPLIVEVFEYRYIWNNDWGYNKKGASPYLISCELPLSVPPSHVSLVQRRCGSANNLMKVKNKKPKTKENFIVSVKKLDYIKDISFQIIEWSEILKILGVNKVEVFVLKVHQNVLKALKFYESEGFMNVKFIKFPSDLPNETNQSWHQFLQNELISFHDTFYENMYSYDYMVPMDTDEFIIPLRFEDKTWMDLLNRTISKSLKYRKNFDCFPVENRFFLLKTTQKNEKLLEIPQNLYFLPNIYRAANFTPRGGNAKSFLRTDRVLTIHSHFPFSCLNNNENFICKRFYVSREDGQLSHYRNECIKKECLESLENPDIDLSLWKFKDQILKNVKNVMKKIEYFPGLTIKK